MVDGMVELKDTFFRVADVMVPVVLAAVTCCLLAVRLRGRVDEMGSL